MTVCPNCGRKLEILMHKKCKANAVTLERRERNIITRKLEPHYTLVLPGRVPVDEEGQSIRWDEYRCPACNYLIGYESSDAIDFLKMTELEGEVSRT